MILAKFSYWILAAWSCIFIFEQPRHHISSKHLGFGDPIFKISLIWKQVTSIMTYHSSSFLQDYVTKALSSDGCHCRWNSQMVREMAKFTEDGFWLAQRLSSIFEYKSNVVQYSHDLITNKHFPAKTDIKLIFSM